MITVTSAHSPKTTFIGYTFNLGDHSARCIADAAMTGGAFSLFEVAAAPGAGTPPHSHQNEDETFFVIEGAFAVMEEGKFEILTAGQSTFAKRGKVHAWQSAGGTTGRMLVTVSPGGFENFFQELETIFGSPANQTHGAEMPPPELLAQVNAAMERFGITSSLSEQIK
ncbi:MAG: cupin domain-containing protein [Armatimonadota bacterium]